MEDSRLLSNVPSGSHGGGLKRPKFRPGEVSATRDFPESLKGCGRNLEPDTGLGSDFVDNNVESVNHEEFVAHVKTLEHENADNVGSMRIKNGMTVNAKGDDDRGYPLSMNMHKTLPKFKRRKVSAVRDFPVAFQLCNGLHALRKNEIVAFDVLKNDSGGELVGSSDSEVDKEPADIDFVPPRSIAETEFDLVPVDAPSKEKVLKVAADFVGSEGGPLDWEKKAEYIVPLAIQEHGHTEFSIQTDAEEKHDLEDDRAGEGVYVKLEIPEPVKQDIVQKSAAVKMYPAFKKRKVSAVRDFPVAFKLINKGSTQYAHVKEENRGGPDSPLVKKPVNPKISVKQEKFGGFQDKRLGSKDPEHIVIVQALMAAPICPWKQGKVKSFRVQHLGSKDRNNRKRGKIESFQEQHLGSKNPDHRKRGKVECFQEQHLGSTDPEHRVIVHALMAAPMCPWSSKTSQGSNKRKCI